MFLPNQAPPVIRTRSTGSVRRGQPNGFDRATRLSLDRKKFKLKCESYDVEYVHAQRYKRGRKQSICLLTTIQRRRLAAPPSTRAAPSYLHC